MDRKEISEALDEVRKVLEYCVGNEWEFNYQVLRFNPSNFLKPEVVSDITLQASNDNGLFMYYRRLETLFMKALRNGGSLDNLESALFPKGV